MHRFNHDWAASPFAYPKSALVLPIDEHVRRIVEGKGLYRLDLSRAGIRPDLLIMGPYWWVRTLLALCYSAPPSLDVDAETEKRCSQIECLIGDMFRVARGLRQLGEDERLAGLYQLDPHDRRSLGIGPTEGMVHEAMELIDTTDARRAGERLSALAKEMRAALDQTPAPFAASTAGRIHGSAGLSGE
jgi:hypothetical protein